MDIRTLALDPRLQDAAASLGDQVALLEKLLAPTRDKGENVVLRLDMEAGRDTLLLLPALEWLGKAGPRARLLVATADDAEAERLSVLADQLGGLLGVESCLASLPASGEGPILEGNPSAAVIVGRAEALLAVQPLVDLASFGFLLVMSAEALLEVSEEARARFRAALRPAGELRSIVACAKINPRTKNLAWDLAANPVELHLQAQAALAQGTAAETWLLEAEQKTRFLLGLMARLRPSRTCVFCDLRQGAEEVALRLRHNGVEAEYILGSLPPERKRELLAGVEAEAGSVLVLTDEGARGLPQGRFPLVVNYDLPLEPELYTSRLGMGDRGPGGFRVVNFVCERYAMGLPAIERHIEASLGAAQPRPDLLLAEDKSEGFRYEAPRTDQGRGPKMGRLTPPPSAAVNQGGGGVDRREGFRSEGTRSEGRRGEGGRGEGGRDRRGEGGRAGRREREAGREGRSGRDGKGGREGRTGPDRSPDIRRSIADATGGSLEIERLSPGKTESGGRSKPSSLGGSRPEGRKPSRDEGRSRGKPPREKARSKPASGRDESRNPYDLSAEERMERYREKYAQAPGGKGGGRRPESGRRQAPPARESPKATRAAKTGKAAQAPTPPEPRKAEGATPKPPREGFLSRLFGRGRSTGS